MTATPTTNGLIDTTAPPSTLQQIQWAIASGTPDQITASFPTTVEAFSDGLCLAIRASGANTLVNPTFAPDGLPPCQIVKKNLAQLAPGDIAGNGHELLVRFNNPTKQWVIVGR